MDEEPLLSCHPHGRRDTPPLADKPEQGNMSMTDRQQHKAISVLRACTTENIGILIALATTEHGLVNDEVRRKAWPILLGYTGESDRTADGKDRWQDLPRHKDEDQVALDVNRSFIYYPKNESDKKLEGRKAQLSDVITQVLRLHPALNYFQGFHDIAQVFLLVLGPDDAGPAVAHVSLLRIRDFMLPSLAPSLAHLQLLPAILYAVDPRLCQHLSTTQPFFALAATLTLYAHDIQEYADIARLFDFLLAQPAVVSVYFFAVIILSRKSELFEIPADEPEMLHSVLSKLPKPLDLEALIAKAIAVFEEIPPEMLPWRAWSKISRYSVLKTTRTSGHGQSITDGEALFAKQAAQIYRQQRLDSLMAPAWRNRKLISRIGMAISVVILSYWLRSTGLDNVYGIGRIWDFIKGFRI